MLRAEVVTAMRSDLIRKSPGNAPHAPEARYKKQRTHGTASCVFREVTATVSIGLLVSVIMWSCILGMSGNMGPGDGVVLGPVAENDHGR